MASLHRIGRFADRALTEERSDSRVQLLHSRCAPLDRSSRAHEARVHGQAPLDHATSFKGVLFTPGSEVEPNGFFGVDGGRICANQVGHVGVRVATGDGK